MSRKPPGLPVAGEVPPESLTWLDQIMRSDGLRTFHMIDRRFTAIEARLDALEPKTEPTPEVTVREMIDWADRYAVEHPDASYGDIADAWRAWTGDTP